MASLKSADAAKTVGELHTAMKAFKTAFDEYVKTLDKAIADPKVTDPAAKPAYSAAAAKLKKELLDIYTRAGQVAEKIVGAQKKAAVDPAEMKDQVEAKQFAGFKSQVEEVTKEHRALQENRQKFDGAISEMVQQIGDGLATMRPKPGAAGTKFEDFLPVGAMQGWVTETKARCVKRTENHAAYLANHEAAKQLRDKLPESYKSELAWLNARMSKEPLTFSAAMAEHLTKNPVKQDLDKTSKKMDEILARLNPRHLEVKAGELSKLYDQLFAHCTAAVKAKQVGGTERAKASLSEGQKMLVKMDGIVKPIRADYEEDKSSVEHSKDAKAIQEKLKKIGVIYAQGQQAVQSAQQRVG
jgi:hypothetical protein